jgi:nucleotide-binding universal stress UspA family protein
VRAVGRHQAFSVQAPLSGLRARSVLLASHGTEGAQAAEAAALEIVAPGGSIHHLVIVPELWQGMSGDGWRINAVTEHEFCDYLEAQIERETLEHLRRVAGKAARRSITYSAGSEFGVLEDCLAIAAAKDAYDVIVIGAPRPKGLLGLRSRMRLDKLARALPMPLLIIPHPRSGGR